MPSNNEPNQAITLMETHIVDIDGQLVNLPVNVVFQLFPYPRVVIELEQSSRVALQQKGPFKVSLYNGAQLDVMWLYPPTFKGGGSLTAARLPADVLDKKVPLKSVQFGILNLPRFYGSQDRWTEVETGSARASHVKLEASGWCVEITGVVGMDEVLKELNRDRGYGFTYDGVITRMDGATFSVEEVDSFLEALRMFLSFVRGNYCSLALVEGEDELGERTWVRWGAHHVESWKTGRAWIRRNSGGDTMAELFPKFVSLFESGDQPRKILARAIDWYLQSNESAPHVGLILTEAALELLSYHVLGRPRRTGKESIRKYIENALTLLKLESNVPQECNELCKLENWGSGPHAITKIRNDLVHPRQDLGEISFYVDHEAWTLGQWYVEMILLKELCYQGEYWNRLSVLDGSSEAIQHVPWASKG